MSTIQVWTIQTLPAWEKFRTTGILRADEQFIESGFLAAYDWLVAQLKARVGLSPANVTYPIWVWEQWENAQLRRPDLRQKGHLPRGEQGVLLECNLPDETVLLSNFVLWHHVLNDWYLPINEADEQLFEAECILPNLETANACRLRKEQSWEHIFDLHVSHLEGEYATPRAEKPIQGVTWELRWEQVKRTQVFKAR